ncbi:MAG: hypothetical protein QS748_05495 [Candidatus Endonucleobacter bathymodioli]|uniref:Uncharacterized protein n=1 Tax=Candidatus Endonucleibacter bathymodioli TaxID=539814 RepID=A0AA90NXQ7_9GAMM|nr:hypothetical protein [Candidatus Endonucleobacter bathymodioli]
MAEINRHLKAKNFIMSEGGINIIDVTPIKAVQSGFSSDKEQRRKADKRF